MFESKDLEPHKGKYYGLYRAFIADNKDPQKLGRLKLEIPSVYGVENGTQPLVSDWVYPCFPVGGQGFGFQCIPPVKNPDGSKVIVWVAFEMGDKNKPVWIGSPISSSGLQSEAAVNHDAKLQGQTTKCCFSFSSPMGHRVLLDDQSGNIIVESQDGDSIVIGNGIMIETSDKINIQLVDGGITMTAGGNRIVFDGKAKCIRVNKQTFPQ